MGEPYNVHIRTTGDPSGAELTQDALEQTAQAGEKIVDAVTKGDRATAAFVAKLRQLTPEQIDRVEKEMRQLLTATEEAGRDTAALRAQLQSLDNVKLDKVSKQTRGIFGGVTGGVLAANAISSATNAVRNHIRASVELADQTEDLAGRAGVTAEKLQTISNVSKLNNGSLQGTADALSKVQISAQGALGGSKPLLEMFERLGITTTDLKNLSPDQLFYKISEAVVTSSDRGRTYADVVGVMGRSSKDLFTTLELGPEKIEALGKSIGVFSKETNQALAEANDTLEKFQNKLTIAAGNFIQTVGTGYKEYYRQLTMTEPEIQKLVQAETDAALAAEETKKKASAAAGALDEMGDAASGAAIDLNNLDTINRQFANRALSKLPLTEQLESLRNEIERIRTEAGTALPGLSFTDSSALFELSKTAGLSKEARKQVIGLAIEYAGLEDRLKQTADADQKLQPERIKRLEEIRLKLAEPNVPLGERTRLLQEELRLLGEVKLAADARAKADAAAAAPKPAGPPKPLSDPAALKRQSDALEAKSQNEPLSRALADLQRKIDDQSHTTAEQIARGLEQIPRAIGDVAEVAHKSFDEITVQLEVIPKAFTQAAAPMQARVVTATDLMTVEIVKVGDTILTLGGTISVGFGTVQTNLTRVQSDLQRQIEGLKVSVGALQRRKD